MRQVIEINDVTCEVKPNPKVLNFLLKEEFLFLFGTFNFLSHFSVNVA